MALPHSSSLWPSVRRSVGGRVGERSVRNGGLGGDFVRSLFASGNATCSLSRRPYLIPLSLSLSLSLSLPAQAQPKLPNLHCPSTMWDGLPTRSPFAVASSPTWPSRRPSGPWPGRGRRNRKRDTVADGRTDGRTDGRGRRRAASASTPNPLLRTTFTVHPSVHPSMRRLRRQQ